jgi:MFS family permease
MLILLAWQTTIPLAVVFFWLVYVNMGIINSPHTTLLNREIPAKYRSAMLSIESLVGCSGAIIGSIGLGYIAEYVSIGTAWIFGGTVLVVSLWLYIKVDGYQQVMAHRPQLANQEESYA